MGDGEPDLDGEELVRGGQGRETVNDVIFLMVKENTDKMPHLKFSLYDALLWPLKLHAFVGKTVCIVCLFLKWNETWIFLFTVIQRLCFCIFTEILILTCK